MIATAEVGCLMYSKVVEYYWVKVTRGHVNEKVFRTRIEQAIPPSSTPAFGHELVCQAPWAPRGHQVQDRVRYMQVSCPLESRLVAVFDI